MEIALAGEKRDVPAQMPAEAFAEFVAARRERAVRVAYRLLGGDAAAAEDVAQNALLRAWRGLGSFRGDARLDTWFYRILVREVHRQRRWQALRQLFGRDAAVQPEPRDERPPRDGALGRRIAAALGQLSDAQREVFVLVHLEELTVREAAEVLGKALGTVKSHLHRALATLRAELADLRDGEEAK